MKYRKLGQTDMDVSEICMGTWSISPQDQYWGSQKIQDSLQAIQASLEAGVNFFDSAEDYGDGGSEEILARGLEGHRREVIIATKLNPHHLASKDMPKACEQSLRRLKTDYIDLYQIHWPNPEVPVEETMSALIKLKDQGKIRAIGVSNFGVSYLKDLLAAGRVESNQLPYSLLWRAIEREILPLCRQHGLGILCYSPLFQGLLTGKFRSPEEVPENRAQTRLFSGDRPAAGHGERGHERETFEAIDQVRIICDSIGRPMNLVAIGWLLAQPDVTSVIAGARNAEQARDNASAAEVGLPRDVVRQLTKATEPLKRAVGSNVDMWMHESRLERPHVGVR